MVAARRQIKANMTKEIHRHFDQFDDFDFDGNVNVFPCSSDGFC
jgi:hypothetical protein